MPVDGRAKEIAASGIGSFFSDAHVSGVHLRVLTVGLGARGAAQIARPLTEVDRALRELLVVLLAVGGIGILVAAGLGFVVARAALAPVSRFTRRTEALTANPDLSQRLEIQGQDELARLARSFNATLDALERSAEAQRHLVADASHELRTPIASLRANIQVLQDADQLPEADRESLRADIIAELDELTALVGDVVELARGSQAERRRRTTSASTRSCARSSSGPSAAPATESPSASACSRRSSAASPSGSAARSRTCSATRTNGARPAG